MHRTWASEGAGSGVGVNGDEGLCGKWRPARGSQAAGGGLASATVAGRVVRGGLL